MWALGTLAYFYRIWVCLQSFYAWFLTCFLGSILRFYMRCWQSRLDFPLKSILAHPLHLSSLIETWNVALSSPFCSYHLCFILLSSSIPGTRQWCASNSPSLLERVRNYRRYILFLVCGYEDLQHARPIMGMLKMAHGYWGWLKFIWVVRFEKLNRWEDDKGTGEYFG